MRTKLLLLLSISLGACVFLGHPILANADDYFSISKVPMAPSVGLPFSTIGTVADLDAVSRRGDTMLYPRARNYNRIISGINRAQLATVPSTSSDTSIFAINSQGSRVEVENSAETCTLRLVSSTIGIVDLCPSDVPNINDYFVTVSLWPATPIAINEQNRVSFVLNFERYTPSYESFDRVYYFDGTHLQFLAQFGVNDYINKVLMNEAGVVVASVERTNCENCNRYETFRYDPTHGLETLTLPEKQKSWSAYELSETGEIVFQKWSEDDEPLRRNRLGFANALVYSPLTNSYKLWDLALRYVNDTGISIKGVKKSEAKKMGLYNGNEFQNLACTFPNSEHIGDVGAIALQKDGRIFGALRKVSRDLASFVFLTPSKGESAPNYCLASDSIKIRFSSERCNAAYQQSTDQKQLYYDGSLDHDCVATVSLQDRKGKPLSGKSVILRNGTILSRGTTDQSGNVRIRLKDFCGSHIVAPYRDPQLHALDMEVKCPSAD